VLLAPAGHRRTTLASREDQRLGECVCLCCVTERSPCARRIDSESASVMAISSETIGSIPRLPSLIEVAGEFRSGRISQAELLSQYDCAVQDSITLFEAVGSKLIARSEQAKETFAAYPIHSRTNVGDATPIPFADGPHALCLVAAFGGSFSDDSNLEIGR
jgi:hypothetical protein